MTRSVRSIVGILLTWQVSASVCYYSVYAATPFFRDAFGLSAFRIGLVIAALMTGYLLFLIPTGIAIDSVGEYRLLTVCLIGMGCATFLIPFSTSYIMLLGGVFALGAMYAPAIPGTNRGIINSTPSARLHLAMGVKQVGVAAGSAISAVLVTSIATTRYGWRAGFIAAGVAGIFIAVAFVLVYESGDGDGQMELPDVSGLISSRPYLLLLATGFFLGANLFTTTGYTILYVEESVGASVAFSGFVLAAVQVAGSVSRIGAGWLADLLPGSQQLSSIRILLAQSIGATIVFFCIPWIDTPLTALVIFTLLGFFAMGYPGIYYSSMSTFVADETFGTASAGGQVLMIGGGLLLPPVFGLSVDFLSYDAGWRILTAEALIATILLALIERELR